MGTQAEEGDAEEGTPQGQGEVSDMSGQVSERGIGREEGSHAIPLRLPQTDADGMRRQKQSFVHDPGRGQHGDCWRTALACVLGVPRDDIPHSHRDYDPKEWSKWTKDVCASLGFNLIKLPILSPDDMRSVAEWGWELLGMPFILCGVSKRGINHAVVVLGPDDIHDPSGSNDFLSGPTEPDGHWWMEFVINRSNT